MCISVVLMYLVARGLRNMMRHGALPDSVMDLPTCSDRLAALGLDFESMRLSVSKYALDRRRVYEAMGAGVRSKGLSLGGVVTQGLQQDDLYRITHDTRSDKMLITPVLHALAVPVRAMILPLRDHVAASKIRAAVQQLLMPVLPEGSIWLQDDELYHATLYHASSHAKPIHASAEVIAEEERAIKRVTGSTCPISAVLDRVVVTTTGVVVACWQVLPIGGEPALLRAALGVALPNAPPREAQMVKEPAMLHTTIARLLRPPAAGAVAASGTGGSRDKQGSGGSSRGSNGGGSLVRSSSGGLGGRELRGVKAGQAGGGADTGADAAGASAGAAERTGRRRLLVDDGTTDELGGGSSIRVETTKSQSGGSKDVAAIEDEVVVGAVDVLSATLCGLRAQFGEVWFIEEQDLLALALNGRYVRHLAPLTCPATGRRAEEGLGAAVAA
ncbi:hypothetical protein HXX76_000270 [Chlamydomonas incerta]|uniref:Uncharacterized protein n=1 Tax=Chlamydomonas incerta TaxID=51695 RepID=A0A835WE08_CHLIN|nr:hypothetical protein HXX76_000270 [Chlamydomonas incerta]|eukprot:KAG2445661.1 hypothetical protein HXX76_000270 [Chlamydomonas incerta]